MSPFGAATRYPSAAIARHRQHSPIDIGGIKDIIFTMLSDDQVRPRGARVKPGAGMAEPLHFAGRAVSLSAQIVADVREALFTKQLRPGDFLGTEKEIASRFGVSRIVARDALRTLQALGVAEIRMGRGGGARVAKGNPRLFAEALAIQLDLTGVSAGEVLDAQRAVEALAAELAAEHATAADHARLRHLLDEAAAKIGDVAGYTRSCRDFHLAVAEASHNRVLVVQLVSLEHVAWPAHNRTLTPAVARRILDAHRQLAQLIEMRDAAGARRLMDEHVKMIRARRVAEQGKKAAGGGCC
jgi:GntR family transcriptional regulator, transcriptional repressor for pyruvate dehydrogenase complex